MLAPLKKHTHKHTHSMDKEVKNKQIKRRFKKTHLNAKSRIVEDEAEGMHKNTKVLLNVDVFF